LPVPPVPTQSGIPSGFDINTRITTKEKQNTMSLITPDIGLLFWMIISFSIGLIILRKYAWGPILDSLKNRENSIEDALNQANKAKKEIEKMKADNEELLKEARKEKDEILKKANDVKNTIIKEAKEIAKEEGDRMISNAKNEIDSEKRSALKEIKTHVAEISLGVAEKILKKEMKDEKEQKGFMDKLLKEINFN